MTDQNPNTDDVNMTATPEILSSTTEYTGAIFQVDDRSIALPLENGERTVIQRQIVLHAPAVVMLVHDADTDRYLVEREYRVGPNAFVWGLPAGLIDAGEDVIQAALRELNEETGVVPDGNITVDGTPWRGMHGDADGASIETVGQFYSSEGMSDEIAHIFVIRLHKWHTGATHFDADEHVQSCWKTWKELESLHIDASNSVIALLYEQVQRMRNHRAK